MTYIGTAWEVQCLPYNRPVIDKARESAAVTMHNATLSDFVNALVTKEGKREGHAYKHCAARARRLKVRQPYNLHRCATSSDVRLVSEPPRAPVLWEGGSSLEVREP
jgi:hypothetical protein